MAEKVKLTFTKKDGGESVVIRKDGGFSVADMQRLTEVVEDLFHEPELEAGEPDRAEMSSSGNGEDKEDESFINRVNREAAARVAESKSATPPAGRGQNAGEIGAGVGITKQGTVDRRTLKGSPENPDPKQQRVVAKAQQQGEVRT